MDPFSISAGAANFIGLGIQVTQSLVDFYSAYKTLKSDIAYTIQKLESLLSTLEILRSQTTNRKFRADEEDLLKSIEGSIQSCEDYIQELQDEARKLKGKSTDGIRAAARTAAYQATYPFRRSTLQKLDEDIDEIIRHLSLVLQVLEQKNADHVQDDINDTKAILDLVRAEQISSTICDWLKAPDATVNYNESCNKWHPGTGLWFVKGSSFSTWLTNRPSFLWLNGFAGCGKSVLCSTAIRYTYRHRRSNRRIGVAFFFFSFNDNSKQDTSAMLRTLVLQLSSQLKDNYRHLSHLHGSYRNAMPPDQALGDCLHQIVRAFDDVYILLDALDESPRGKHRGGVLGAVAELRKWREPGLHILVTSREETDILDELDASQHETVSLKNDSVNHDIVAFISKHLRENRRLRTWEKHHEQIEIALTKGAKGVFRWVECQFKSLEACPRSKRRLDRLLESLPRDLDRTYERMLLNIDEESIDDARRILTLLCYAKRPLTVLEVIEGIAVELGHNPRFDPDGRLSDKDEIRRVCPGLIELDFDPSHNQTTIRIAHFSVQEYLESERMHKRVATFSVRRAEAHAEIASICLTYLLEPALSIPGSLTKYPLALYAAINWYEHYRDGDRNLYQVERQALRLFQHSGRAFETWVSIWSAKHFSDVKHREIQPPVYYVSLLGLDSVLSEVFREMPSSGTFSVLSSSENRADINSQDRVLGKSLQAASQGGHETVVRLLLDRGANVNAQGGLIGNALVAASRGGYETVVRLLLDRGANVNAQGGVFGNALQAASRGGHETVARLLLGKGADVNAQGGVLGNALQAASRVGNEAVVRLLLDRGANVNAQGGKNKNALLAASRGGHEIVARLLLEKGADKGAS